MAELDQASTKVSKLFGEFSTMEEQPLSPNFRAIGDVVVARLDLFVRLCWVFGGNGDSKFLEELVDFCHGGSAFRCASNHLFDGTLCGAENIVHLFHVDLMADGKEKIEDKVGGKGEGSTRYR